MCSAVCRMMACLLARLATQLGPWRHELRFVAELARQIAGLGHASSCAGAGGSDLAGSSRPCCAQQVLPEVNVPATQQLTHPGGPVAVSYRQFRKLEHTVFARARALVSETK
jgi:hypothetical protein